MRRTLVWGGLLALLSLFPVHALAQSALQSSVGTEASGDVTPDTGGPVFGVGGLIGYQRGLGVQAFGTVSRFARGFPLSLELRAGYTAVAPGSAPDARKIFINNATNGTPSKAGSTVDLGLDGVYPLGRRDGPGASSVNHTALYGGVRYSRFKGNFKYVGGNEDFDVTSSHWGVAAGIQAGFGMTERADLILSGGMEYFFSSRLTGHDTSYAPDGDNVNPREDYSYADADEAIDQPTWRPVLMLGFRYRP